MPGPGVWEQPALPGSAGRGRCPGDKMIDWVSPPAGMRPLSLIRPPAWPLVCAQRPAAADSGSRELAAVVPPSGDDGCGCSCPGLACPRAWSVWNKVQVSGGGERVVAELGQDVAGLPDDLAGLREGGALVVLAVFDGGVVAVVGGRSAGVGLAGLIH